MDFLLITSVLLFSVVVHEVAHAWQALREGDPTARDMGRITLNPFPHLDLVGSFIVPLALYLLPGDFLFGWAKPVPVNPRNYRNYRIGDIRVSLAGIVANLALVVLCVLALGMLSRVAGDPVISGQIGSSISKILTYGLLINLILAYFNLLPIPPLDGSHVVYHLLPPALGTRYRSVRWHGLIFLFLLFGFFTDVFSVVFAPVGLAFNWLLGVALG